MLWKGHADSTVKAVVQVSVSLTMFIVFQLLFACSFYNIHLVFSITKIIMMFKHLQHSRNFCENFISVIAFDLHNNSSRGTLISIFIPDREIQQSVWLLSLYLDQQFHNFIFQLFQIAWWYIIYSWLFLLYNRINTTYELDSIWSNISDLSPSKENMGVKMSVMSSVKINVKHLLFLLSSSILESTLIITSFHWLFAWLPACDVLCN